MFKNDCGFLRRWKSSCNKKPSSVKEEGFNNFKRLLRPDLQVRSLKELAVARYP
jgi:hypothetical protein